MTRSQRENRRIRARICAICANVVNNLRRHERRCQQQREAKH